MCNNNILKYAIIILSAIAGIIGGVLFYTGTLTNILAIVPYLAVIAAVVFALIIVLLLIPASKKKALSKCLCLYSGITVFFSILTIALVLTVLSITLVATSILSAVLTGFLIGSFAGILVSLLFFVFCLISKKCPDTNCNRNCCCCCYNNNSQIDQCGFDAE